MADAQPDIDWRTWWDLHGSRLLLFARQQCRSVADAEDVLQDALLRLWKAQEDPTPVHPGAAFLAIRRTAIDHVRSMDRRSARESVAETERPAVVWFERTAESKERQSELEVAIHELPKPQQEVLILKIWGELTFEQIASTLEIPANTAASRYRYALQHLRQTLQPAAS